MCENAQWDWRVFCTLYMEDNQFYTPLFADYKMWNFP